MYTTKNSPYEVKKREGKYGFILVFELWNKIMP
jgi:hypothetical protein